MKNLLIIIFILAVFAHMISCNSATSQTEKQAMEPLQYLALGDSYTIGESVAENGRWPVVLAHDLSNNGIAVSSPRIIATTGWTTDELQAAIKQEKPHATYDLVSLLIGVNNQYRGVEKGYTLDQYKKEFTELLDEAIRLAQGNKNRVFVVSIPDYGVTPFAEGTDIDKIHRELIQYNNAQKEITETKGILFLDITPISLEAKSQPNLVAEDKLHPSALMYKRWVDEVIYKEVAALIGK